LAEIPARRESSIASQSSIPRLWTTIVSGTIGDPAGCRITSLSAEQSFSSLLLL
jgi:hypothetical protein